MTPRVAIPIPTSFDPEYNDRSWPQYAQAIERAGGEPVPVPLNQPPAATARLLATCAAILLPGSGADVNPQKYGEPADPRSAPSDAARENVDELLLQDAHNLRKPILTICFGTQMLNVWRGGTLIQDLPAAPVNHKAGRTIAEAHPVEIAPESLLAGIVASQVVGPEIAGPGIAGSKSAGSNQGSPQVTRSAPQSSPGALCMAVNSSHHQAIATAGDGLRIGARSPQDNVIEAIEGGFGASSAPANTAAAIRTGDVVPHALRPEPFILGVQWHPERTYDESPASRALFARFIAEARAWSPREPQLATTAAESNPHPHA